MKAKTAIKRPRKKYTCVQCARSKRKCDKKRPTCSRCEQLGISCTYDEKEPIFSSASINENVVENMDNKMNKAANSRISFGDEKSLDIAVLKIPTTELWDDSQRLVDLGSVRYIDSPFGAHTLLQYDQFTRAICASVHGVTFINLRNHLNGISSQLQTDGVICPFIFIEKAIARYMEYAKLNRAPPAAIGSFFTPCAQVGEENLLASLQPLLPEIENALLEKKDREVLLKFFYENLYPFHPYVDIPSFETAVSELFVSTGSNSCKINIDTAFIREKIETLSLLLIMMNISLKCSSINNDQISIIRISASEKAKQLSQLSYRLLCLLDPFRYPSENGMALLLYFFVSEHLDPESSDTHLSHSRLLLLKQLSALSIVLGLHCDSLKIKRLSGPGFARVRRLLWLGIQSLRFQVSLPEGDVDRSSYEYMQEFSSHSAGIENSLYEEGNLMDEFNIQFFNMLENKYQLHMLLSKLTICSSTNVRGTCIADIIENAKRAEDFMLSHLPISALSKSSNATSPKKIKIKDGVEIEACAVEKAEVFLSNLVGRTCLLNVWDILSLYFERESIVEWEMYEEAYHSNGLKSVTEYLGLAGIVSTYLANGFGGTISQNYRYVLNKQVCYVVLRLLVFQSRLLLRLSYKKHSQEMKQQSNRDLSAQRGDSELDARISKLITYFRNQMAYLLGSTADKLQESYLGIYQVISIFRYILYTVDIGKLTTVTNDLWQRSINGEEIPESINEMVYKKWGLDVRNSKLILQRLINSKTLASFNNSYLQKLEESILSSDFGIESNSITPSDQEEISKLNEEEVLNTFLQNEWDIFSDILGDNLIDPILSTTNL